MKKPYVSAIITSAGLGTRMNADINKNLIQINGTPIIAITLDAFEKHPMVDEIILVCHADDQTNMRELINKQKYQTPIKLTLGGKSRQESAYQGLLAVRESCEIVMIHDGARPFVSECTITESINSAEQHGAACAAVPAKDTCVLEVGGKIDQLIDRSRLFALQTPQTFRYAWIKKAHEQANESGFSATDDTALVKSIGLDIMLIEGSYDNIKITTQEDLIIAEMMILRNTGGGTNVH